MARGPLRWKLPVKTLVPLVRKEACELIMQPHKGIIKSIEIYLCIHLQIWWNFCDEFGKPIILS